MGGEGGATSAARHLQPLVGGTSPAVAGMGYEGGAVLYTERGAVREELASCAGVRVVAMAPDLIGGLVALVGSVGDDDAAVEVRRLVDGRIAHRARLADTDSDLRIQCAAARRAGSIFIHHATVDNTGQLLTFRPDGPGLVPGFCVPAPADVILAQDAQATELAVVWDTPGGLEVMVLDSAPPTFAGRAGARAQWYLPPLAGYFMCHPHREDKDAATPQTVLDAANDAARRADWYEVRRLLDGATPAGEDARVIAHRAHLLGLALLRTGAEPARAREVWQAGALHDRDDGFACRLGACLELIEPLPAPLPVDWWNQDASLARQLRGAIATADELLAAANPRGAIQVLRRRAVTRTGEVQSMARLAAAWLAAEPEDPDATFDKAIALARFVAIAVTRACDLPIESAWSDERLNSLVAQAEQWLAAW